MKDQDIVKGNIGNALHDVSPNHVVATAYEIYDTNKEKRQEDINKDTDEEIDNLKDDVALIDTNVKAVQKKTKDISNTYNEDSGELIEVKSDDDSDDDSEVYVRVGTLKGKKGVFTDAIYDLEGEDKLSLQEKVNNKVDIEQMDEILQPLESDVKALKNKTSEISKTAIEGEDSFIEVKSDDDTTAFVGIGTKNGKSGIFAAPIYDIEGEDEKSLQEKVGDVQTEVNKKADAETVDAAIREAMYKVSDISKDTSHDESEAVVITTDSGKEITRVSISTTSEDDTEGFDLATDDGKVVTSVDVKKGSDDSEVVEFGNNAGTETYAKVGMVDGKKGIFTAALYDLEGNPFNGFTIDTVNDVITIAGKKYKMIEYIE